MTIGRPLSSSSRTLAPRHATPVTYAPNQRNSHRGQLDALVAFGQKMVSSLNRETGSNMRQYCVHVIVMTRNVIE